MALDRNDTAFAMQKPRHTAAFCSSALKKVKHSSLVSYSSSRDWQRNALYFINNIGECRLTIHTVAARIASCNLQIAKESPSGEMQVVSPADFVPSAERKNAPVDIDGRDPLRFNDSASDLAALRVLGSFKGPMGTYHELMYRAAIQLQGLGESFLVGEPVYREDTLGEKVRTNIITWNFLSPLELEIEQVKRSKKKKMFKLSPSISSTTTSSGKQGDNRTELDQESYVARLWEPSIGFYEEPDCALRALSTVCEELINLTETVLAISRSRRHAGMLIMPSEIEIPEDVDIDPNSPSEVIEYISDKILEHFGTPISDNESAASIAPLITMMKAEYTDKVKWEPLVREFDDHLESLRREALQRLAQGLSGGHNTIFGLQGLNHWAGAEQQQKELAEFLIPFGQKIANFLTVAYLRPMLETYEGLSPEEANTYYIQLDASPIATRVDKATIARELYRMRTISREEMLRANGFNPADSEISREEMLELIAVDLIGTSPKVLAPPLLSVVFPELADALRDIAVEGEEAEEPIKEPTNTDPGDPVMPDVRNKDNIVSPKDKRETEIREPDTHSLLEKISVACDMTRDRASEKATNRFISKAKGDPKIARKVGSVEAAQVLTTITPEDLRGLGLEPQGLYNGEFESLSQKIGPWVNEYLLAKGGDPIASPELAHDISEKIAKNLREYCLANFHNAPLTLSNGLSIPIELVESAFISSGVLVNG